MLLAGCAGPPAGRPVSTPPVPFGERQAGHDRYLGRPLARIRRLMMDAIDAPVTLRARSAPLQDVADELGRKTGLGIAVGPKVCAAPEARSVDLSVHGMPARYALDWLTRLAGAVYAIEEPYSVCLTRDRGWATRGRLTLKSYSVGALARVSRPVLGKYNQVYEAQRLLALLRAALHHVSGGRPKARLLLDGTCSRLAAMLPRRGHAKLARIVEEMKRPRKYEPPAPDEGAKTPSELLTATVLCNFPTQDVRDVVEELGKAARVHVGFDYRRVPEGRRRIRMALGQVTLGAALGAVTRQAGLGAVVAEPGRRFWILGKGQSRDLLRSTGGLAWDRATVRSVYVEPLVRRFGIGVLFDRVQKALLHNAARPMVFCYIPARRITVERVMPWVTAAEKQKTDVPMAFYHHATGRLIVLHEQEAQCVVARCLEQMTKLTRPARRPRGGAWPSKR